MATADEVFSAMEGTSTEDRYAIIDNDLRTITIPDSIPYLGVMSDDSVLKLPFKMPATYCGFDLSEFTVYINYINASNIGDRYRTNDVTKLDDGHLTFSWIVGRNAVSKVGNVKFIVCMRKYDDDNITVIQEFNTTICTMPVLPGLETDEQAILPYTDLVNELVTKWQSEIDTAVNRANAIPTYIPSVSTNGIISWRNDKGAVNPESVDIKGPRGEKGDPGVGTIADIQTGSLIHMENAYPGSEIVELTVYGKSEQASTTGKNLFDISAIPEIEGIKRKSDGSLTVSSYANGTSKYLRDLAPSIVPGDVCALSLETTGSKFIYLFNITQWGHGAAKTVTEEMLDAPVYIYGTDDGESTIKSIQIELGSTATAYEPYTGGKPSPSPEYPQPIESVGELSVASTGKNLLDQSIILKANGASFDGTWYSVSLNSLHRKFVDGIWKNTHGQAGQFTVSLKCFNSSENTDNLGMIIFFVYEDGTSTNAIRVRNSQTSEREYSATSDGSKVLSMITISYSEGSGYIYKIKDFQIEAGSAATEYEPFGSITPNLIVSEDGTAYELRSLPDGTRDELVVSDGRKVLRKRVGSVVFDGTEEWTRQTIETNLQIVFYTPKNDVCREKIYKNALMCDCAGIGSSAYYTSDVAFVSAYSHETAYPGQNWLYIYVPGITTVDGIKAFISEHTPTVHYKLANPIDIDLGPADPIVLPEQVSNVWTISDPSTDMQAEWFTTDGKQVWKLYSLFHSNMTESEIDDAVAEGIPQGLGDITDEEIIEAVIGGLSNG